MASQGWCIKITFNFIKLQFFCFYISHCFLFALWMAMSGFNLPRFQGSFKLFVLSTHGLDRFSYFLHFHLPNHHPAFPFLSRYQFRTAFRCVSCCGCWCDRWIRPKMDLCSDQRTCSSPDPARSSSSTCLRCHSPAFQSLHDNRFYTEIWENFVSHVLNGVTLQESTYNEYFEVHFLLQTWFSSSLIS